MAPGLSGGLILDHLPEADPPISGVHQAVGQTREETSYGSAVHLSCGATAGRRVELLPSDSGHIAAVEFVDVASGAGVTGSPLAVVSSG